MKYVLGMLVIVVGAIMVIKTEWFLENFGQSSWAEDKLGGGGSRLMYKLIGIAVVLLSLMAMTGMLGEVIVSVFGGIFGLR